LPSPTSDSPKEKSAAMITTSVPVRKGCYARDRVKTR
jgi:hypothetical protein